MSTTNKKKTPSKPAEVKARYSNGSKIFIICFAFAGSGIILEGEVKYSTGTTYPMLADNGKITGNRTNYNYLIRTAKGDFDLPEASIYPNYTQAAIQFAQSFVLYLK